MQCPRCGYHRQKSDDNFVAVNECPSCGIVYNKHKGEPSFPISDESEQTGVLLKPSPVDAESLKKARERVEKRLNERLASQMKDTRHDKTLELARQFASEGVRKRQAQWQQLEAEEQNRAEEINLVDAPSEPAPEKAANDNDPETEQSSVLADAPDNLESVEAEDHDLPQEMDGHKQLTEPTLTRQSDQVAVAPMREGSSVARAMVKQSGEPGTNNTIESQNGATFDTASVLYKEFDSSTAASWDVPPKEATPDSTDETTMAMNTVLSEQPQSSNEQSLPGMGHTRKRWRWIPGGGLSQLLPIAAWLILIAGLSGAILSWTTMTDAEAGMQTHQLAGSNPLPLGLLLGFAYLVTGVLGFAFFWVSSLINRQLKDIRRLLLLQPIPANGDAIATQAEAHADD
jgi:Zn-finger nucleic acid-binding protein